MIRNINHRREGVRRYLPKTIYSRLILVIILPILLVQFFSLLTFSYRHVGHTTEALSWSIINEIDYFIKLHNDDPETAFKSAKSLGFGAKKVNLPIPLNEQYNDKVGKIFIKEYNRMNLTETKKYQAFLNFNKITESIEIYLISAQKSFKFSYGEYRLYTSVTEQVVWFMTLIIGLLSTIWALFIARNQVRPIRKLSKAMIQFSRGNVKEVKKLKIRGSNEIRQTIHNFKIMTNRIIRHKTQRNNMLSGISHDLRTPLTRMKLLLEMSEKNKTNNDLKDNIKDMENMIESYLSFSKGTSNKKPKKFNLDKLLKNIINKWKKAGKKINHKTFESTKINANNENISRVIENIISNGFKYGKNVDVELIKQNDYVHIIITDDGIGIPNDKLEEVFNPFYRIDESRNNETGGTGLGLSVAMDIITFYGGKIKLKNRKKVKGITATITLPLAE